VAEARAELGVCRLERVRVARGEERAARLVRDLAQRHGVGRHRDRLAEAAEVPGHGALGRPQRDRVDGDAGVARERGALHRLQEAARLGPVREEEDRRDALLRRRRRPRAERDRLPVAVASTGAAAAAARLFRELDRERERVADRRAAVAGEEVDRVERGAQELAVPRRRRRHLRVAGERDQADLEPLGDAVEERPDGLLRRGEPRRLDVLRLHRARDVDDEDHGRALPRHERLDLRPCERARGRREREHRERRRQAGAVATEASTSRFVNVTA
jgi:hypothetical protein